MLCVDVIGDAHSNLAALGSERSGMPPFALRMLQCIGYFSEASFFRIFLARCSRRHPLSVTDREWRVLRYLGN